MDQYALAEEGAVDQYALDEADGLTARPQQLQEDPWSLGDSRRGRPTVTHQAPDQQPVTRPAPGLGMEAAPGLHTQQAHGLPMGEILDFIRNKLLDFH